MEQNSSDPATNAKPRRGRPRKSENDKNKLHHIRLRKSKPRAVKVIAPVDPAIRVKKTSAITKTNLKSQSDATQTGLSLSSPVEPHTPAAIKSNIHSLITITSPTNGTKKLLLVTDKSYPADFHSMKINCKTSNVTATSITTSTTTTSVADNNNQFLYQLPNNKKPGMVILTTGSQTQANMPPKQFLLIPTSGTTDLALLNPPLTAVSSSQSRLITSKSVIPADRINRSVTSNSSPSLHDEVLVKPSSSNSGNNSDSPTAAVITVPNKVNVRKHVSILPKPIKNISDYATKCAKLKESVEIIRGNKDVTGTSENSKIVKGSANLKTVCLTQKYPPATPSSLEKNGVNCSSCENNGSNQQKYNFSSMNIAKTSLNSPTVPHMSSGLSSSRKSDSVCQTNSISDKKITAKRPYGPRARKSFPKVYNIPPPAPPPIKPNVPFSSMQLMNTSQSWCMAPSYSTVNSSSIPLCSFHSPSQEFISQTSFLSDHPPVHASSIIDFKQTLTNVLPDRNINISQNNLEICNDSNRDPMNSQDLTTPLTFKRQIYSSPPKLTIAPGFSSVKSKQKSVNKKKKSAADLLVIKEREEFFDDDDCTVTNVSGDMSPPKLEREDLPNSSFPPQLQPQYQTNTQLSSPLLQNPNTQLSPTLLQNHTENLAPSLPDRTKYAAGLKKNRKLSFGKLFSSMLAKSSKYKKSLTHYTILFEIARSIHCCVVLSELGYFGSVDLNDLPSHLVRSLKCSRRCRQHFMKTAANVGSLPLFRRHPNVPLIKCERQMIRDQNPASPPLTSSSIYPMEFTNRNITPLGSPQLQYTSVNPVPLIKQQIEFKKDSFVHNPTPVMKPQFHGNPDMLYTPRTLSNTHFQTPDTEHNYYKLSNERITANYTKSHADLNSDSINKGNLPIFGNNCGHESVVMPNTVNTFYKVPNNAALSCRTAISNTGALRTPLPLPLQQQLAPPLPFSTENSIIGKLKYEIVPKEKLFSMNSSSNMIPLMKNQNDAYRNGILKGNSNNQLVPIPKTLGYKNVKSLEKATTTTSNKTNISGLKKPPEKLPKTPKSEMIVKKKKVVKNKNEKIKRKTFDEKMQLLKENECFMNNTINSALTNNNVMEKLPIKNIKKQPKYEHAPSLEEVQSFYNEPTTTDRVVMLDANDKLLLQKKLEKQPKIPKKRGRPRKDSSSKFSKSPSVNTHPNKTPSKRTSKKAKLQKVKSSGSMKSLVFEIQNRLTRNQGSVSKDVKSVHQCVKKSNIENVIHNIYMVPLRKKKHRLRLSASKLKSIRKKPINWKKIARQPLKTHAITEKEFALKSIRTARKWISTVISYTPNPLAVTFKTELNDMPNVIDSLNNQNRNEYQTTLTGTAMVNNSSTIVPYPYPYPPPLPPPPPPRKRGRPAKLKTLKMQRVSETPNYDHTYQIGVSPCDNSLMKNSSAVARRSILQASKKPMKRRRKRRKPPQRRRSSLPPRAARQPRQCTKATSHSSVSLLEDLSSNLEADVEATREKRLKRRGRRRKKILITNDKAWKQRKRASKIRSKYSKDVLDPHKIVKCPGGLAGENIAHETKLPLMTGSLLSCNNTTKGYITNYINDGKIKSEPSGNYDDVLSENNIFMKPNNEKTFDNNTTELTPKSPAPFLDSNSSNTIKSIPSKSTSLQQVSQSLDFTECDNFSKSNTSPISKTSPLASLCSHDDSEQTYAYGGTPEACHCYENSTDNTASYPQSSSYLFSAERQPFSSVNPSLNVSSFPTQLQYSTTDQERNISSSTPTHHSALLNKFNVGLTPELARIQRLKEMLEQQKRTIAIVKQKLS